MANEITLTVGLQLVNSNLRAQFPQVSSQYTQTTAGMSDQVLTIGTSEEDVAMVDITTPGVCVLHNLDSTNFVKWGPKSAGNMVEMGRLKAGDKQVIRFGATVTLRMIADTASCKVRVMCLET